MKTIIFIILLAICQIVYAQVPTNGLIAYYPFNGNANDESGNGNDGDVFGASPNTDRFGNQNSAYSFDGVNDYIVALNSTSLNPTYEISMIAWVYPTNNSGGRYIIRKCSTTEYKGYFIRLLNGSISIYFGSTSTDIVTSVNVPLNQYSLVAATLSNGTYKVYVNGNLSTSGTTVYNMTSTGDLYIGRHYPIAADYFLGKIDDIYLYNRALSSSEIWQLYNEAPQNQLNQGLVAYYPFNGNANDESGNGHNGNPINVIPTTDRFGNNNSAYKFQGPGSKILTSWPGILGGQPRSVSIWVRKESTLPCIIEFTAGGNDTPIAGSNWACSITESASLCSTISTYYGGITYSTNSLNNQWHHYVWVLPSKTSPRLSDFKLYQDGNLLTTIVNSENPSTVINTIAGYPVSFGRWGNPFGSLDDVRIYDRALTENEIIVLYNEGGAVNKTLNGTITSQSTSQPINGATVLLTGANGYSNQKTSNSQGFYEFTNIPSGNYNCQVSASGYVTENHYLQLINQPVYTENFSLEPTGNNCIQLSDELTICADVKTIVEQDLYQLSGNVNINGILYFDGVVTVDDRLYLINPEITGTCAIFAHNIQGVDKPIYPGGLPFNFIAEDDELTSKSMAYVLEIPILLGGFPLTMGGIAVGSDEVYIHVVPKLPFPLDELIEIYSEGEVPTMIENVSFDIIYSHSQGTDYAGSIEELEWNSPLFNLEDVYVEFDSYQELFGGGFMIQIPGEVGDKSFSFIPDSLNQIGNEIPDEFADLEVEIQDEKGSIIQETTLKELIGMQKAFGLSLLKVGMELEFISGAINKLIITLGVKIPINTTGLFITEMTGGVDNLTDPDNWEILADVDIETGLELPGLGSPVKLNDFGIAIHPMTYLRGSGEFEIFNSPVSDGLIEYDHSQSSLRGESNMNLNDLLIGHNNFSLEGGEFNGSANVTLKTPDELPWWLIWAKNWNIGFAEVNISNYEMRSMVYLLGQSLAEKIEFGNPAFPWYHLYLGSNFNELYQIWKGVNKGKQAITFQVPENTNQLILVAGDTINNLLFDFSAIDPQGKIFDQSNTLYMQFENTKQTLMIIEQPKNGDWQFNTDYSDPVIFVSKGINTIPTSLVSSPMSKGSKSSQILLDFTDFADTLSVKVFYDSDRKNFDGTLIQEFELMNNATLDFTWQNQDVPNGEYYIYCRIDDGQNSPVLQYAPGSILVENDLNIETPVNLFAIQEGDSLKVGWDASTWINTVATTVYYKNITNGFIDQISVIDTNLGFLKNLDSGQEYDIWCKFINDNGTYSEKSNIVNIIFSSSIKSNPPYFKLNPDRIWVFIEDEQGEYDLLANDADGDILTFNLPDDTLGMYANGNKLNWTPSIEDRGFYNILITVTDGNAIDSVYQEVIVYTQDQVGVKMTFSSLNLYEDDNMFIKLKNYRSPNLNEDIILINLNTSEQTTVSCRKVNDFDFIGKFELSYLKGTTFLGVTDGDTITATYIFNDSTYIARSFYDSNAQPSDIISPADIDDLSITNGELNEIKLSWTATGDDGQAGKAYRYDIRYNFQPIETEDDYLTAFLLAQMPYPSTSGETDSLIIDLSKIPDIINYDTIFFSIKAEDEMQNRSGITNNAFITVYYTPESVVAEIQNVYQIKLNWTHPAFGQKGSTTFESFAIFRKYNNNSFVEIKDTVTVPYYTDDLYVHPDGYFQYAVQAVYSTGMSNLSYSDTIMLDRFIDVNIYSDLDDTINNQGIFVKLTGLDNTYHQSFNATTNPTGLLIFGNVFKSTYKVEISKQGYGSIIDTILVNNNVYQFNYILSRAYIYLDLMVLLEGPFNGTDMNTTLNPGQLPLSQPYNTIPWNYTGTESASTLPLTAVDWMLIELRETTGGASTAISDSIVGRQAGILLSNGLIVSRDGSDNLQFNLEIKDNLYVIIWHRNHYGIMSANALIEINGLINYDFTTSELQTYGGSNAVKELGIGKWGMVAADGNGDGIIDNLDLDNVWSSQAGKAGYKSGDFNLNIQVDNKDKDDLWLQNIGKGSQVPE